MSDEYPHFKNPIDDLILKKPIELNDPIRELIIDKNPFKRLAEVEVKEMKDPIQELIIDKKKKEEKERRKKEKEESKEKEELNEFNEEFEKEVYGEVLDVDRRYKPRIDDVGSYEIKRRREEQERQRTERRQKILDEKRKGKDELLEESVEIINKKLKKEEERRKNKEEIEKIAKKLKKTRIEDDEDIDSGGFRHLVVKDKSKKEKKEEIIIEGEEGENNINKIIRQFVDHYETTLLAMDDMELTLNYDIFSDTSCKIEIERNGGYVLQSISHTIKQNPNIPIVIAINALRPILKNGNLINENVRLVFSGTEEFLDGIALREHLGDEDNEDGWNLYEDNDVGVRTKAVPPGKFLVSIEIWVPKNILQRKRINGAFIPFCLKDDYIELKETFSKYDVYTERDSLINKNTNCFYICCKNSGLFSEDELIFIQSQINDHFVCFTKLTPLFVKLNTTIVMNYYTNGKAQTKYVNKGKERVLRIYMIRLEGFSHYFINEMINSPFEDIKGKITSHDLITIAIEKGILVPMTSETLMRTRLGLIEKVNVKLPNENYLFSREMNCVDKEENKNDILYFCDLECITSTDKHIPFCGIIQSEREEICKEFYCLNCCERILNYVTMNKRKGRITIYFHNLSYDGRFFAKYGIISSVEKDSKIYSITLRYNDKIVVLKDSYAIIPTALKNFNSMFDLGTNNEKEIYPYNFITKENMFKGKIEGVGENENPPWDEHKKEEFISKVTAMNLVNGDEWNVEEYTKYYCRRDVNILRNGFIKFRKMCKEEIKIDPTGFLSLSSMAFHYFKINSFKNEGIYEYTGTVREYMRKAIYGGRCMTNRNKKFIVNDVVVDFDACSLYPSAMSRLYLPTGVPNLILDKAKGWLFDHLMDEKTTIANEEKFISCFIVTIVITKVGKKLDFPLIVKKVNGVNFNVNEDNIEMTVDNIYLEDLIKYQEIEFEIKEGIYWKGNKSDKLSKEIKKVYDLRNKYKTEKNPMQNIYKLLMNSSYGKTIQKTILKEVIFKRESELEKYWVNNYFNLIKGEKIVGSDIYRIEKRSTIDEEFTPIVIGVLILSMSKRIMNELFSCADEEGIMIYYQDTDSIHLKEKDLNKLVERYEVKYDRKLIGMNMGQFHTDFENIKPNSTNVVSKRSIFLGKKAYLDCLIDDQGNEKDQVRMKGVPGVNIIEKGKEFGSCWNLYNYLYEGNTLEFDLIKYGPHFKLYKSMEVESLRCFKRKVRFGNKSEEFINLRREETIRKMMEDNKSIVVMDYIERHEIPLEIQNKIDVRSFINKEEDCGKANSLLKRYELLSKYILLMYFCYTSEITDQTIGYIVSKLFLCAGYISKLLYPSSCPINFIEELNNKIISLGITQINYNNDNDVIQNYDKIMLFESPITFQIDEPNRVAKKLLISVQKENN